MSWIIVFFTVSNLSLKACGYVLTTLGKDQSFLYSSLKSARSKSKRWNRQTFLYSNHIAPEEETDKVKQEYRNIDKAQYNTLPRLFVGELSKTLTSDEINEIPPKLKLDARIQLSLEQTHYLTKVMRLFSKKKKVRDADPDGALIRVFDGIGGEWLCRVLEPIDAENESNNQNRNKQRRQRISQNRKDVPLEALCVLQLRPQTRESLHSNDEIKHLDAPWLFFAPIKKQRARFMVEKCTELGVGAFCPILTQFTDNSAVNACIGNVDISSSSSPDAIMFQDIASSKQSDSDTVEKLSLVACEAAEQSERLNVPAFVTHSHDGKPQLLHIEQLLKAWTSTGDSDLLGGVVTKRVLMICRERLQDRIGVHPINDALQKAFSRSQGVAFLVGPEGGWSPDEEILFDRFCEEYEDLIVGVSLGSNVLRAETASMLAIGSVSLMA